MAARQFRMPGAASIGGARAMRYESPTPGVGGARGFRRGTPLDPIVQWFQDAGTDGLYVDGRAGEALFQDAARTQPAAIGDPVGGLLDLSGNGYHAGQTTPAARPLRTVDGLAYDGVDDKFDVGQVLKFGTESFFIATLVDVGDTGKTQSVVSSMDNGTLDSGYSLIITYHGWVDLWVGSTEYLARPRFGSTDVAYGKHVIVAVLDREAGEIRARLDGQPLSSDPGLSTDVTALGNIAGPKPLWLGGTHGTNMWLNGTQTALVIAAGTDYQVVEQALLARLP